MDGPDERHSGTPILTWEGTDTRTVRYAGSGPGSRTDPTITEIALHALVAAPRGIGVVRRPAQVTVMCPIARRVVDPEAKTGFGLEIDLVMAARVGGLEKANAAEAGRAVPSCDDRRREGVRRAAFHRLDSTHATTDTSEPDRRGATLILVTAADDRVRPTTVSEHRETGLDEAPRPDPALALVLTVGEVETHATRGPPHPIPRTDDRHPHLVTR